MSATRIRTPSSRCRFGIAQTDITPPVGIYHRMWGAALHDRASGVHRPLTASVLWLEPLDQAEPPVVLVAIDHCLFRPAEMECVLRQTHELTGATADRLIFAFSHTHAAGYFSSDRLEMPGGELIPAYLDRLAHQIAGAYEAARDSVQPALLTYGQTPCAMGANRDYWDEAAGRYVCGFNPDEPTELPVTVVRISADDGTLRATLIGYPCHPTTLAWQNTLISADYVGALRETVERATGAPCAFLLSPCGDVGPRHGFVGDTEVADRNGRQVGYAALSVLSGMAPAGTDFVYTGPVLSGATIGTWAHQPFEELRSQQTGRFRFRRWQVHWPLREDLPQAQDVRRQLAEHAAREAAARMSGDERAFRDARALAERDRRLLSRIAHLPEREYGIDLWAWQLGDAIWLAVESEPYHALQRELQRRFPDVPLVIITLANGAGGAYFPERADYGKPLYQAEIALLAPGCLEAIGDALARQIEKWVRN